ncbi:MAG: efflux RND transporter periplasmic adaptor subunit, partial [Halioglobus sp.]|nr:efflux RND transporter periplasmic adaptor subunit [Halioglobus sp.]
FMLMLAACKQAPETETASGEPQAAAIPVEVELAGRGDIVSMYSGTAPIEAFAEATVIAKVGGEVREILVEEGDKVRVGQLLARLDGDRLRLAQAQAEANLQKLRRDFQRNQDLKDKSLISTGDFEKIQYEMEALEASYKLASLEVSYTDIRAPIDGVISERFVKKGNTIDVNAKLFQVTSLDPLLAYLHVPEREYRRMARGMPASIQVDALGGARYGASIARISPVVDPSTGTFKITVEVTDPQRRLKPGMFARIGIVSDTHADALQIPRSAIVDEGGETSVFVVDNGLAKRLKVSTGLSANDKVEILNGLNGNEQIIVVGQAGLRDGTRVQAINAPGGPQSALAESPPTTKDES